MALFTSERAGFGRPGSTRSSNGITISTQGEVGSFLLFTGTSTERESGGLLILTYNLRISSADVTCSRFPGRLVLGVHAAVLVVV